MRGLLLAGLILAGAAAPVMADPVGGPPPARIADFKLPQGRVAYIGLNWPEAVFFLDLETIKQDGNQAEVSILYVIKSAPKVQGREAVLTLAREKIDCASLTHQLLGRQGFSATGELLIWSDTDEPEPVADSATATAAALVVCNGRKLPTIVNGYAEAEALGLQFLRGPPPIPERKPT